MSAQGYNKYIHMALGGAICLLVTYILLIISTQGLQTLFLSFNCLGLLVFEEVTLAVSIINFGITYLPGGFCGGLYTGYRIKENLRIMLLFPGIIGFVAFILLRYFTGYLTLSNLSIEKEILVPLAGHIIGVYLGGYTINWKKKEE